MRCKGFEMWFFTKFSKSLIGEVPKVYYEIPARDVSSWNTLFAGYMKMELLGGAGGVGSLAIQLAKEVYGAFKLAATPGIGKFEFLKSSGVNLPIDYTKENFEDLLEEFDVVFDAIRQCDKGAKVVKERGSVVDLTGVVTPLGFRFVVTSKGEW